VTIQELIDRHAYLRSNASYNVKKLVELGYIEQSRAPNDRRAVLLRITDKAREALSELRGEQARFAKTFAADPREPDRLDRAYQTLRQLERAWEDYLRYERG
jgi:DNA-binding MarR family transcriptional regulator